MPDKPQKTVFVLGAGASAASDWHLPVMNGFLHPLASQEEEEYPALCRYVRGSFPKAEFTDLNLEEVFTQLELSIDGFASIPGRSSEDLLVVRRQLLDFVRKVLDRDQPVCRQHQKLLRDSIEETTKDSIVTLNYDLVIDHTLHSVSGEAKTTFLGRMYSLLGVPVPSGAIHLAGRPALGRPRGGLLLKLHGALDWTYCPTPSCKNHGSFCASWLGEGARPVKVGEICTACGADFECVLVPPTMRKSFERFPKLGLIWRLAYEELRRADRVLFWGVSMAPSDYYLHWLIRSSLVYRDNKPEVVVINPCKEAVERTKQLTGVEPQHYASVEQYTGVPGPGSDQGPANG